jgi:hypothetical protein
MNTREFLDAVGPSLGWERRDAMTYKELIRRADAAGLHRRCMMRLRETPCIILTADDKVAIYVERDTVLNYDTNERLTVDQAATLLGLGS